MCSVYVHVLVQQKYSLQFIGLQLHVHVPVSSHFLDAILFGILQTWGQALGALLKHNSAAFKVHNVLTT